MDRTRLVVALVGALCLGGAGCSSRNNTGDGDAGPADSGDAGSDAAVFIGPGDLHLTWTVNGMPAATACAAAGAATVEIQLSFGGTMQVPCTAGEFSQTGVLAGQYSIGTNLLRADGTAIYRYTVETTVQSGVTDEASVDFSPPGSLSVRWTVNGSPAASTCATTTAYGVQVQVRTRPNMTVTCGAGRVTYTNVQAGHFAAHGIAFTQDSHTVNEQDGEGDVPSGATGVITLDFSAPARMP